MHYDSEEEESESFLVIHSTEVFRGKLFVKEYLDLNTGELIPRGKLQMVEVRPDARTRREQKLNALRAEVRDFAVFLLRFRNKGGDFLVSLKDLIKWYSMMKHKSVKHINRYLPKLVDAAVLDFDLMLNEDFMWVSETRKSEVKGNVFRAYTIFQNLLLKERHKQNDVVQRVQNVA